LTFRPVSPLSSNAKLDELYFPYDHCLDFICPPNANNTGDYEPVLVYGGDVCDQGGSDLYVMRQLIHFQKRYPNHVYFVLGNRDSNKMRIISELGNYQDGNSSYTCPPHGGVYWLRGSGKLGDPQEIARDGTSSAMALPQDDPVGRLQWILRYTMGSPRAFDYRRWELEQEQLEATGTSTPVSDMQVVDSYRRACHPETGEIAMYLANAKLVLRLGEVLFLHGSLPITTPLLDQVLQEREKTSSTIASNLWDDLSFAMPWLPPGARAQDAGVHSIDDWLSSLNDFVKSNVQSWRQMEGSDIIWSTHGGYNYTQQPYSQLLQYGMGWTPDGVRNPTIVYSSFANDGMPHRFFPFANTTDQLFVNLTRDFMERSGVRLICCGHQPQGQMPNTIKMDLFDGSQSAYILCCDTSYSGDVLWHNENSDTLQRENLRRGSAKSGRGQTAVSEVIMEQCCETGKLIDVHCHGRLSDGTEYETHSLDMDTKRNETSTDNVVTVGKLAPSTIAPDPGNSPHGGPWWTQAAFRDGSFLLSAGKGYQSWNRIVKP